VHHGQDEKFLVRAIVVHSKDGFFGFRIQAPSAVWLRCVLALEFGAKHAHMAPSKKIKLLFI